ncbi:bifunctional DNA primase/polymerase [bacterium]|nr:bifunctional DNA primase/polymerase [bacterium]MDB4488228.1 bifunctional DNA primase/polymerase [bacterium]MDB4542023.1 bifunctional DNA primase/polymerase [bacterium]
MKKDPQAVLQALGREAVLLPIREGTKATMVKRWPEKTFEDTQTSSYQNLLEGASAIAVSLGAPSGGLCSIDFDCEEAMRLFLRVNPFLEETLRTKGRRGANLWITITGNIPPLAHFKDSNGNSLGEWRSDRSYTIISGKHPTGIEYQTIIAAKPLEIAFEEIKWPDGWTGLPTLAQEEPKPRIVAKAERPITTKPKAHIQNDFDYLKEVYRIHDAWEDLGLPGEPSESCRSPFRDDLNPSFSVFDAGRKWKDYGTDEHGDVFDFVQKATGFNVFGSLLWIQGKQNHRFNFFTNNNTDEHAS